MFQIENLKSKIKNSSTPPRIAAFFDFDNTLLDGDSQDLELRYLRRRGWIKPAFLARLAMDFVRYRYDLISSEKIVRHCIEIYRGHTLQEVEREGRELFESVIRVRLSTKILSLLEEHRESGHAIVLLSASLEHILRPAADALGIRDLLCTRLETGPDGLLTGRPCGPICLGFEKRFMAERFARVRGISLEESFAWSDHHADVPFLSAVGHPTAVNPTKKLLKIASASGWPVIDR